MRLINADALMRSIEPIIEAEEQIYGRASWHFAEKCRNAIADAPTIEQEPRKSLWVYDGDCYFCNQCGTAFNWWADSQTSNYCPNCGAYMR